MSNATKFFFPVHDGEVDNKTRDVLQRLVTEIDRSIRAITPQSLGRTVVVSGGGGAGGGGSFTGTAIMVTQAVTAGVVTVNFPALASTNYGVHGFVLLNGSTDIGLFKPKIPPDTDTRGFTSVQGTCYDTGILYAFIILAA